MTIETEEKTTVRTSQDQRPALMWCRVCRRKVEMVTTEQAAQIAGVSERTVHGWIEAGTIHFVEAREHRLICVPGLSACRAERMQKRTTSS